MAKRCSFCDNKLGIFKSHVKFKDGFMCRNCLKKYGQTENLSIISSYTEQHTVEDFKQLLKSGKNFKFIQDEDAKKKKEAADKKKAEDAAFEKLVQQADEHKAHKYGHYYIDLKAGKILRTKSFLYPYAVFEFKDVISYQVNKNGHTETKHHGITRAVVGGALAGGAGAVVGAMTGGKSDDYLDHLGLIINLADGKNIEIPIHSMGKVKGWEVKAYYSSLNDLIAEIQAGMAAAHKEEVPTQQTQPVDAADEIAKFKKLADDGTITQEEFEAKKKQLLGL